MSIDINSKYQASLAYSTQQNTALKNDKKLQDSPTQIPFNANDTHLTLTTRAQQLNRLVEKLETISEINHEKVAALKAAIANGEYKVNAKSIAANILETQRKG